MAQYTEFPKPKGEYTVGRCQMDFSYTSENGSNRELTALFFYPADSDEGKERAVYAFPEYDQLRNEMLAAIGSPSEAASDPGFKPQCYEGLAMSKKKEKYPVLFYNHGAGNMPQTGTLWCEEMASVGYVVVSVGHPDGGFQKFLDGHVTSVSQDFIEGIKGFSEEVIMFYIPNPRMLVERLPHDEAVEISRTVTAAPKSDAFSRFALYQSEDTRYVADCVEKIEEGIIASQFKGRLDLKKGFGIFGHSFGGTIAAMTCRDDERFVCGINYDSNMLGCLDSDLKKPFMQLVTPLAHNTNAFLLDSNTGESYCIVISSISHFEFCDALFTSVDPMNVRVRDPLETRDLILVYTTVFFSRYLLGISEDISSISFDGVEMV